MATDCSKDVKRGTVYGISRYEFKPKLCHTSKCSLFSLNPHFLIGAMGLIMSTL